MYLHVLKNVMIVMHVMIVMRSFYAFGLKVRDRLIVIDVVVDVKRSRVVDPVVT